MKPYQNAKLSSSERASDLLSRMTLREKVGQLNQRLYGFSCYERAENGIRLTSEFVAEAQKYGGIGVLYGLYRADPWSKRDYETGIPPELARRAYNTVQRCVMENSRLGIPVLMSSECPHGHQALGGYLLPVNLCAGATWNPKLLQEAYGVCARQLKSMGVDLALMSVLDVLRDPRWGRSEECYSEDPYLSACLAESAVMGCQENGVTAVAKHFCAQGECKGGVNASAASIGPRELREIHLPSAAACCRAGVGGIMAAYNEIDGLPCHANADLLRGILRDELGFDGIVMADGTAVDRLDVVTGDNVKSGAVALRAGVDVSLWDTGFSKLEEAVQKGYVSEQELDEAVLRVLKLKFERGLFEHPYLDESLVAEEFTNQDYPQSLEMARQGIILLKNEDNLLPLSGKAKKIAVIGPNADDIYAQLGDYSPPLRAENAVTVRQGLKKLCGENCSVQYARGCGIFDGTDEELTKAVALAKQSDIAVLVLGGSSSRFCGSKFDSNGAALIGDKLQMDCGEGVDCADLRLCGRQEELFLRISALGKPVITVLIAGRPYAVPKIAEHSTAFLQAFYPGPMGGQAIAEILFGITEPGGRLSVSIPRSSGQLPVYYNSRNSYQAMHYHDLPCTPLYTFGDGLSYTEFACAECSLFDLLLQKFNHLWQQFHPIAINGINAGLTAKNRLQHIVHTMLKSNKVNSLCTHVFSYVSCIIIN
ncbi:MAG TPA: glycoside hydrolase family 3 N-terminal domain-containing protein [Oscillospiraceae bacterium]|nr:glycoside hydrolase family 3 N-terminal domain-containing protein [Oscillospiraceae bacterium]